MTKHERRASAQPNHEVKHVPLSTDYAKSAAMHIKYERQMHPFFSFTRTPLLLTSRSCVTHANTLHQENEEDLQQSKSVTHTLPW